MFRRGDTYYALLGGCTCMGLYGGGVAVLTAKHALGPWTNLTSTLDPGCPMEKQSTCFQMGPARDHPFPLIFAPFHPLFFCSCTLADRAAALGGRRCDPPSSPRWLEAFRRAKFDHFEVGLA